MGDEGLADALGGVFGGLGDAGGDEHGFGIGIDAIAEGVVIGVDFSEGFGVDARALFLGESEEEGEG